MKHCQHCKKDFATPSSLKRHIIAKHAETIPALVRHEHRCTSCDAGFARNETLQRHVRSKHTLELMERCQFCLENFRKDYFARHKSRCATKYWAKVCGNAELTKEIQDGQSTEINGHLPVRRDMSPDAQLIPATGSRLRVVHEIFINVRLASEAFNVAFRHYWKAGNIESCLEAITASLRLSVPIKPDPREFALFYPFFRSSFLAEAIGRYVRGENDVNLADIEGALIDYACAKGAADLIEPLIWRGAVFGNQSLLYAVQSGSFDTVRFCLARGADPNDYSLDWEHEDSPLLLASTKSETSHIACLLIENGATVFVSDDSGYTPLHWAAQRADTGLLRVLLTKESSSDFLDATTNEEGKRALDAAIESMDSGATEDQILELVSALLDAGAEVNGVDYQHSALSYAVVHDREAIIRLLLDREPESPRKTQYLKEALMEAIDFRADDTVQILVEAGASVDGNMLRHALQHSTPGMVEVLLKTGARGDSVGHDTLECLFGAARDQQKPGAVHWPIFRWVDAMGKCKLLCLYFPEDQRLRRFMNLLEFEDGKFR
jgi:ankyrin repeat protein